MLKQQQLALLTLTISAITVVMSMEPALVWEHGIVQIMEPHLVL